MTRGVPWWARFFGVREGKANAEFKFAENGRLQNAELAKVSAKCQRLDRYRRETERLSYYV
jgi:hypothetical protein